MVDLAKLQAANAARWTEAKLTRSAEFAAVAHRLVAAKARYQAVEAKTGVPWWVVAVIHERESSQRWDRSLAQGDPWNRVSTHEPEGRGPFNSWEEAAIDALVNCHPYAAHWKDWSPGGAMTLLEQYNGLGYAMRGLPSPYVWSGTNQYRAGKYVADHVFDPDVVDRQLGCAGLVLAMQAIDSSIRLGAAAPASRPEPPDIILPPAKPPASATSKGVAAGGGGAAAGVAAREAGLSPIAAIAIALGTALAIYLALHVFNRKKD